MWREARNKFAPITGAWIETPNLPACALWDCSHLSRVRGLKQFEEGEVIHEEFAPITGAWIETLEISLSSSSLSSHLSRVRGLKQIFEI